MDYGFLYTHRVKSRITKSTFHKMEKQLLADLGASGEIKNSLAYAEEHKFEHKELTGVIKSLQTDFFVNAEQLTKELVQLTAIGKEVAEKGSPEARFFAAIPDEGISAGDLTKVLGKEDFKAGNSQCMKSKWIKIDKAAGKIFKQVGDCVVYRTFSFQF
jgi:phenylalanyl-tRNA synthetase alpha chain